MSNIISLTATRILSVNYQIFLSRFFDCLIKGYLVILMKEFSLINPFI